MKAPDDAAFRITLAKGYLERAEGDFSEKKWDRVVGSAQEAVENAGKSILYHFRPIPNTHDVDKALRELIARKIAPQSICIRLDKELDAFLDMGKEKHNLATYGDEQAHIAPWELFQEPAAKTALDKARRAVALAEQIFSEMTKPPPESD